LQTHSIDFQIYFYKDETLIVILRLIDKSKIYIMKELQKIKDQVLKFIKTVVQIYSNPICCIENEVYRK
jgi:hypothetical protein